MGQVFDDKPVLFEGDIYRVSQTWDASEPVVTCVPPNERLVQLIHRVLLRTGRVDLAWRDGYFELQLQR
jgi:hypothetical protein